MQHGRRRLLCLGQGFGHHHPLACSQPVGLDHNRCTTQVDVSVGCHGIGKHLVLGSWNTVTLHESLGEGFGALELRSLTGRAKDPQIQQPEFINQARCQRRFGPDHGQPDLVGNCPGCERLNIGDGHIFKGCIQRCATVARRQINFLHPGRLRQLPSQGMLTTAATNHQNLHAVTLSNWALW